LRNGGVGTFGLRETDALALAAHFTSPNIGSFLNEAVGKDFALSGTLDSILRVSGTLAHPQLQDMLTLQSLAARQPGDPAHLR